MSVTLPDWTPVRERLDRERSRLVHRPSPALVLGGLLLLVALVHTVNIGGFPAFFDDEGTYYSQAWAIQHGALSPYTYWYDHPPAGWIQLAGFTWLTEFFLGSAPSLVAGRLVMVGYTLATAVLVYRLSRNVGMRRFFAGAAMALWALSPLVVYEGRHVFLDNMTLPWLLGAFVLVTNDRRHLWQYVGAGACFAVAVLTKETVLVTFPALLMAVWHYGYRPTRAFALMGLGVATGLLGVVYPLFAALRNELFPGEGHVSLWDALVFQMSGRAGSGFVLAPGSGAYGNLQGWLGYDSGILIVGGVVAAVACLYVPRLRAVGVALLLFVLVALRPDGYMPFMFVIAPLPFAAVLIAGVLDAAWRRVERSEVQVRRVAGTGLAALCVAALALVAPTWGSLTWKALTVDLNDEHGRAMAYVRAELPRDSVVVVDNTYWNDMVRAGWSPGFDGAVWFYKPDTDPEFLQAQPDGWKAVDYLLWTNTISQDPNDLARVREAYDHSVVLAGWGEGTQRVEIRQVLPDPAARSRALAAADVPAGDLPAAASPAADPPAEAEEPDPVAYDDVEAYVDEHLAGQTIATDLAIDTGARGAPVPEDWRDVDYVVSAATTASTDPRFTQVRRLSFVVASFGEGADQVDVRRVFPDIDDFEGILEAVDGGRS